MKGIYNKYVYACDNHSTHHEVAKARKHFTSNKSTMH